MDWRDFLMAAIPVPFVEHGRDYDGWDCWGLVICGYRDVLGVELPDHGEDYQSTRELRRLTKAMDADRRDNWTACGPRPGAVAMILRRNLPVHVGIVMPGNTILHAEERVGTVNQRRTYLRTEGFYELAA